MILVWFLSACETSEILVSDKCTIEINTVEPTPLVAGQPAQLTAYPMSEAWDSRISFGQISILAESLERTNCEACDDCKIQYECIDCFDCDSCDNLCETSCNEALTFTVPESALGDYSLLLSNRYGQSSPFNVQVTESTIDTGVNDSGE